MPKTLPPGVVELGEATFQANVMPDVFDARDLEYRPRLQPLAAVLDRRSGEAHVYTQEGNSCTGHAVATMINTVLGAGDWPTLGGDLDLDNDPALVEKALLRPFYRVNAYRLDDMQSAVSELNGIVASALVHTGWVEPTRMIGDDGSTLYVIERSPGAGQLGGHAFAIVGYNNVGFLIQNSWGKDWGSGGSRPCPTMTGWPPPMTRGWHAWEYRPFFGRANVAGCWIQPRDCWPRDRARINGNGTFQNAHKVIDNFAYTSGWRVERHPRFLADLR